MDTVMALMGDIGALVSHLPVFIEEQNHWVLILITAVAAGIGVGAVTRNHEFGWAGKIIFSLLLFGFVFSAGLGLAYLKPVLVDVDRLARSQVPAESPR